MEKLMIDSDVLINWLAKERERNSNRKLWVAPTAILELGEMKQIENHLSLLSIFEIRFVLRRKKGKDFGEIEQDLNQLGHFLHIDVPTESVLQQANQLQGEWPIDPFDSILLAQTIFLDAILISRDNRFLKLAAQYVSSYSPEGYVEDCLRK
ncbi:MAG TPA: PIN domain-containing protein [Bacillales bacterium]